MLLALGINKIHIEFVVIERMLPFEISLFRQLALLIVATYALTREAIT